MTVKPILVVKVNGNIYDNQEKLETVRQATINRTCNEYHVIVTGVLNSEKELPIFEVHGVIGCNFDASLVTGDLSTKISGKDFDFFINKNNKGRERGS